MSSCLLVFFLGGRGFVEGVNGVEWAQRNLAWGFVGVGFTLVCLVMGK